jgi:putative spermidine/putrescine transport system substrate-binding protein
MSNDDGGRQAAIERSFTMRESRHGTALARRRLIGTTLLGAAGLALPAVHGAQAQANRRIVLRDPGGPYTPGFRTAFYEPFQRETGIEVVPVVAEHDPVVFIRSMVEARNYAWDGALLNRSANDVLVNPATGVFLEETRVEPGDIPARYASPTFLPVLALQTVFAYRTDAFRGRQAPRSWADFWNVRDFPGRRSLRRNPLDTLEQALLADGVPADQLYPLDLDRAFRSLDRIKRNIQIWWTAGAQTSQIIKTGEVALCPTWNARAQAAIDEGAPAQIVWNQGLLGFEGFCIVRGGPKADLVREFIAFTRAPERQAAYTRHLSYGPVNPKAYEFIDAARAQQLPTFPANLATAVQIDTAYWGEARDAAVERFNAWLLG